MTELTRDEALVACAIYAIGRDDWYASMGKAKNLLGASAPPEVRSALAGTGGGEHQPPDAPDGYWWKRCQEAEARAADNARTRDEMEGDCRKANTRCGEALRANKDLKSRLAAAEKELDARHAKAVALADKLRDAREEADDQRGRSDRLERTHGLLKNDYDRVLSERNSAMSHAEAAEGECGMLRAELSTLKEKLAAAEKERDSARKALFDVASALEDADGCKGGTYENCPLRITALASSLIAAEKRAEEAEEYAEGLQLTVEEQRKNMAGFITERDALKAELAHAEMQRDAANARVKRIVKRARDTFQFEATADGAVDTDFVLSADAVALAIDALVVRAVERERERCAKIVEEYDYYLGQARSEILEILAAAIRATKEDK